ncbi:MAG: DUF4262 domain-containing protein [Hyphomonas sp.]
MTDRKLNQHEQNILSNISKHGWHGLHVFDPERATPGFSYSVGFPETLEAPEFIVFGLPHELAHHMLWEVFSQIKGGAEPLHGRRWSDLLKGFDCVSLKADHDLLFTEHLISSRWHWNHCGRDGFPPVMQLVWPSSTTGLFPWEPDCHESVISAQPKLWTLPVP